MKVISMMISHLDRKTDGDTRTIEKFLLFPKCINGEWRWWNTHTIKQKYCIQEDSLGVLVGLWEDVEWLRKDKDND